MLEATTVGSHAGSQALGKFAAALLSRSCGSSSHGLQGDFQLILGFGWSL